MTKTNIAILLLQHRDQIIINQRRDHDCEAKEIIDVIKSLSVDSLYDSCDYLLSQNSLF